MIQVFDDVIPKELNDYHNILIFGSVGEEQIVKPQVPFLLEKVIEFQVSNKPHYSFVHYLIGEKDEIEKRSEHFASFINILNILGEKKNLFSEYMITRARILLNHPQNGQPEYGLKHYDSLESEMKLVLYYINGCETPTKIFKPNGEEVTVDAKRGRIVMFPASWHHSPGLPVSGVKAIVNFNFYSR